MRPVSLRPPAPWPATAVRVPTRLARLATRLTVSVTVAARFVVQVMRAPTLRCRLVLTAAKRRGAIRSFFSVSFDGAGGVDTTSGWPGVVSGPEPVGWDASGVGSGVTAGVGAATGASVTTAVGAEASWLTAEIQFDADTTTRRRVPLSAAVRSKVGAVAPATLVHAAPAASQRCHW